MLNRHNKAGLLEKIELKHRGQGDFVEYVSNIEYNEKAQRTKIEYGNGTVTTYTYNPKNFRLTKIKTLRSNTVLQEISYIYDPEGNITEIYDAAQQTLYFDNTEVEPRNLYEYDALYRLLKAQGREHISNGMPSNTDFVNNIPLPNDATALKNYTQTYQYDELGNLLQMKNNGVWTRDYFYDFNTNNYLLKHTENGQNEYLYDVHGNITKLPHLQELFWDYSDQLKEVTLDTSNNTAYYVYDAAGDRVRKVVIKNNGTIVENRFYVGNYEIFSKKTNGTLNTERETLHINDDKSKVTLIYYDTINETTNIRYQLTNHLGSASLETDQNASIISYEEYHPFGTSSYRSGRSETEVSLKRYKYVFKELDNETGLYYYGMRYYAPWIARFISVDPLQFKYPIYTPFQYAGNKPISYIDLDGAEEAKVPDLPPDIIQRISNPDVYREEGTQREAVYLNGGSFEIKKTQCWHSGSDDANAGWYWLKDYVKINDVEEFAFNLAKTLGHINPSSATEMYGMTYKQYIQNAQFKLLELSKKYNYSDTFYKIIGDNYKDFITGYQKYHGEAIQEVSMLDIVLATTGVAQIVKGAFQYAIKQAINRQVSRNLTTYIEKNIASESEELLLQTKLFPRLGYKFGKHNEEWGNVSKIEYFTKAVNLSESKIGGDILGFTSKEGWTFKFNKSTGEFLTVHPEGYIETLFKPKEGINYYLKQLKLYGN